MSGDRAARRSRAPAADRRGAVRPFSIHEAAGMNTEATCRTGYSSCANATFARHAGIRCRRRARRLSCRPGRTISPAVQDLFRATATYSSDALRGTIAVSPSTEMDEGLASLDQLDAEAEAKVGTLVDRVAASLDFDADLWRTARTMGCRGAVRRPEENARDPHYIQRGSFADVAHPESGTSYTYVAARWYSPDAPWTVSTQRLPRAR